MNSTSRRAAAFAAALLALAAPALAQQDRPIEVERPAGTIHVEAGEVQAAELLQRWAEARGKILQLDPQVVPLHIEFAAPADLDAATLRHVLDFHDIVLVERGDALEAHHRRNVKVKLGPPQDHVEGLAPDDDRYVTCAVPIEHGGGAAIFAAVRGLLSRDVNHLGNVLYVQGPEVIVLADLARNVRSYQQLIAALDRPSPVASVRVRLAVYEVDRAWWAEVRAERAAASAQTVALREGGERATLLGELDLQGARPTAFERLVEENAQPLRLTLEVRPVTRGATDKDGGAVSAEPGAQEVRLRLEAGPTDRAAPLRLTTHATFAAIEGSPSIQTFTGRAGAAPTDVVLVAERR